jgi:hypothetical protein
MKSHNVRFWELRPRRTAKGDSWTVRWTVAGGAKSVTLARKAQAERHRARLMQAADRGEAFDGPRSLVGDVVPARNAHSRMPAGRRSRPRAGFPSSRG